MGVSEFSCQRLPGKSVSCAGDFGAEGCCGGDDSSVSFGGAKGKWIDWALHNRKDLVHKLICFLLGRQVK